MDGKENNDLYSSIKQLPPTVKARVSAPIIFPAVFYFPMEGKIKVETTYRRGGEKIIGDVGTDGEKS